MVGNEVKEQIISKHGGDAKNTGKTEVQIALFTERIQDLTGHAQRHKKDNHSRRGLIRLVAKRRKLLDYLAKNDISRYRAIVADLGLRR